MPEYYLVHHGIKDQKWGIRRYQNEDGSLTPEGRKRYGIGNSRRHGGEIAKNIAKNVGKAALVTGIGAAAMAPAMGAIGKSVGQFENQKDRDAAASLAKEGMMMPKALESYKKMSDGEMKLYDGINAAFAKSEKFPNYSKISDEDLAKVVKRMNLEQQYKDLTDRRKPKEHDRAREAFQITAAAAGIAIDALTVAVLVTNLIKAKKG